MGQDRRAVMAACGLSAVAIALPLLADSLSVVGLVLILVGLGGGMAWSLMRAPRRFEVLPHVTVAMLLSLQALLPCTIACTDVANFAAIGSVSLPWVGVIGHVGAAACLLGAARTPWRYVGSMGGIGISAFLAVLLLRSGVLCPVCWTGHTLMAALAVVVMLRASGIIPRLGLVLVMLVAGLVGGMVSVGFQPAPPVVTDPNPPAQPKMQQLETSNGEPAWGRFGSPAAPVLAELALDPGCGSCRTFWQSLDPLLQAVADGRCQLVIHPVMRSEEGWKWGQELFMQQSFAEARAFIESSWSDGTREEKRQLAPGSAQLTEQLDLSRRWWQASGESSTPVLFLMPAGHPQRRRSYRHSIDPQVLNLALTVLEGYAKPSLPP